MIQGVHHTSFTVSDLEEAESFFTELMGMLRVGGGIYDFDYIRGIIAYPDAKLNIAILAFPERDRADHLVELIEYLHPAGKPVDTATNRPGNAHLCFAVADIDAEIDRLRAAGVAFKSEAAHEVIWGINKGAKGIYFNGPDGIALELLQPATSA